MPYNACLVPAHGSEQDSVWLPLECMLATLVVILPITISSGSIAKNMVLDSASERQYCSYHMFGAFCHSADLHRPELRPFALLLRALHLIVLSPTLLPLLYVRS